MGSTSQRPPDPVDPFRLPCRHDGGRPSGSPVPPLWPRPPPPITAQVARAVPSPKAIARALDVEPATVSNYLNTLVRLGLLLREVPATERDPERSRKSRYVVTDPYLRFYHRFLAPQLHFIVRGAYTSVWKTIERHWRAFVGTHTFEELCREWVYAAAEAGGVPFFPHRVGSPP